MNSAYENDFAQWATEEGRRLAALAEHPPSGLTGIDLPHLAEEIAGWAAQETTEAIDSAAEFIAYDLAYARAREQGLPDNLWRPWLGRRGQAWVWLTNLLKGSPSLRASLEEPERSRRINRLGRAEARGLFRHAGYEPPEIPEPAYTLEGILQAFN
ncbi:DUF29 family protein [Thiohalorhabdus methylotrophus]|uniref:DUF29 family protein n=1 Tax=Thiohalorhabdus methylotrophus TaxID=3242694 RepID=A0ABV4U294_9GAMM